MGSEDKILEILKKLKEANAAAISRQTGFSTAYVDILCKSLIKSGGLTKAAGKYSLAGAKKKAAPARFAAKRAVRQKKKAKKIKKSKQVKKTRSPKSTAGGRRRKNKIGGWLPDWLK